MIGNLQLYRLCIFVLCGSFLCFVDLQHRFRGSKLSIGAVDRHVLPAIYTVSSAATPDSSFTM